VFPLVLFIATRAAYLGMSAIGLALVPMLYYHPERRQQFLQAYPALDGLCRWDCGWFVTLVKDGYSTAENAKIFPLFPLLGWAIEKATGIHHLIVFLVVSNLASLASYYLLFHIFRQLEGEEPAKWALLLMASYPFAYFQATAAPESLLILLTALSFLLADRGRHIWAGIVLGLGVMARHVAIFYLPGLLVAQLRQRGFHPRRFLLNPAVLGLVAPFVFVAGFAWHLKARVGDPLAFWNARTIGWGALVWYGWRETLSFISYRDRPEFYFYLVCGLIPWMGAVALVTRKRWLELAVASITSLIIFYEGAVVGLGRYTASVWPAFLPLGLFVSKRPWLQGPVIVAFALFQGLFFFLFSHQFRVF
jgi:Gpi18-like mannosyltransferase